MRPGIASQQLGTLQGMLPQRHWTGAAKEGTPGFLFLFSPARILLLVWRIPLVKLNYCHFSPQADLACIEP